MQVYISLTTSKELKLSRMNIDVYLSISILVLCLNLTHFSYKIISQYGGHCKWKGETLFFQNFSNIFPVYIFNIFTNKI